jgi:protein-tyrosine phosphatase
MKIILVIFFTISQYMFAITNFGKISEHIFRGSYPYPNEKDYKFLREQNINTIINLEYLASGNTKLRNKYNMTMFRYPTFILPWFDHRFDFTSIKAAFKKVIEEKKNGNNIYIHCIHGSDRTSILAAALTIRENLCFKENVDTQNLAETIKLDLQKYNFHTSVFPTLYTQLPTWTTNPPEWICEE